MNGFRWVNGRASNGGTESTLFDPDGNEVARIYKGNDRQWYGVTPAGDLLVRGKSSSRTARAAVDAKLRDAS